MKIDDFPSRIYFTYHSGHEPRGTISQVLEYMEKMPYVENRGDTMGFYALKGVELSEDEEEVFRKRMTWKSSAAKMYYIGQQVYP